MMPLLWLLVMLGSLLFFYSMSISFMSFFSFFGSSNVIGSKDLKLVNLKSHFW